MKLPLAFLALFFGIVAHAQVTRCYHQDSASVFRPAREHINMGGISTCSEYEFLTGTARFMPWDTKAPRIRITKNEYKQCRIKIYADSNTDTGPDEIELYYDGMLLWHSSFTQTVFNFEIDVPVPGKLKFVVKNAYTSGQTPGAFELRIWLRGTKYNLPLSSKNNLVVPTY